MTSPPSLQHFRISTHLKDLIGRGLVTDQFVAVFELVKNAFDAHARRVDLALDLDNSRIWIVDDGKGMDADAIRDRWLFVAYSAKAEGTEDGAGDYRDDIRPAGQYAGSKGIGRFSCDTLGKSLILYSRTSSSPAAQKLTIQWRDFEESGRDLFHDIPVPVEEVTGFPTDAPIPMPKGSGTVLRIDGLRGEWGSKQLSDLRRHLEKLIDPFGTTTNTPVNFTVIGSSLSAKELAELQGPVGNDVRDLLAEKTTRIKVQILSGQIRTELVDRGRTIYCIKEDSPYDGLERVQVRGEVFFLNQSAKNNFTRRMGVRSVAFGSIFLFVNRFRIFPIGEETDDTFGLNRRKQQGSSRYLGTRDVMGRIDVTAPPGMLREATSRDAGLINDAHVRDLYDAIRTKFIFRLERYVVGVNWPDKADNYREDASGLSIGATRSRVTQLIGRLAATTDLDLEYYDPDVVELFDEDAKSLDSAMKALITIAERQGDKSLLRRIELARARQAELEQSEREATELARRAAAERARADERIARLERQTTYLAATQDMTVEQMTLLLHQVRIYAGHIDAAINRALDHSGQVIEASDMLNRFEHDENVTDVVAAVRVRTRRVMDDLEQSLLENNRLTAVAQFATNARFELQTDVLEGNVIAFLDEYINEVLTARDGPCSIAFESHGLEQQSRFRPVDLVVVVDNLLDNAGKHGATLLRIVARRQKGGRATELVVTDDGRGLDEDRVDPTRIFDKGYRSSANGTGLGLYHARKVMQQMDGGLQLDPNREAGRATFIITLPRKQIR